MQFNIKKTEGEALGVIDVLLEGLSVTDPIRKTFVELRELFVRDFAFNGDGNNAGMHDDITKMIRDRLDHKDVMSSLTKLLEVLEEHKITKAAWDASRVDVENISILTKQVVCEITTLEAYKDTRLKVEQGNDVADTFYYSIGNRLHRVNKIDADTNGSVIITHTYSYKLASGTNVNNKRRDLLEYLRNMHVGIDNETFDISCIEPDTLFVQITEVGEISCSVIKDAVTVIDSNTGTLLSINKTLVRHVNSNMSSNTLILLTNDIALKDANYYRVIGKGKVVVGTYSYKPNNPEYTLIYAVDGVSVEESDIRVIRSQYHIYRNRVDAENLSNIYNDIIKNREDIMAELSAREVAVASREAKIVRKESIIHAKGADSQKKLAEAKKVDTEADLLTISKDMERVRADNAEKIVAAELDEKIKKVLKQESDIDKNSSESDLTDLKSIAAVIGIVATGYAGYNAVSKAGFFDGSESIIRKFIL